jgi:hypothetical protein
MAVKITLKWRDKHSQALFLKILENFVRTVSKLAVRLANKNQKIGYLYDFFGGNSS